MFVVKYNSGGNVLWAVNSGGANVDYGYGITTDDSNVYVTGNFRSNSIIFGSVTLNISSPLQPDMYIVKYNSTGNVLWARSTLGNSFEEGRSIITDLNGNIYVTGQFNSSTVTFGTYVLNGSGSNDIFIVKYDANASVLWATTASGTDNENAYSITTDANNNVYVTGLFSSDTLIFGNDTLTNAGSDDIFLVKYDSGGNVLWSQSAGGVSSDASYGVITTHSGNVFITGRFSSNSITFGNFTLNNTGDNDVFIAKYSSFGTVLLAISATGNKYDESNGISTDAIENAYITGWFQSDSIVFDGFNLINATTTATDDFFIAVLERTFTGMPDVFSSDNPIQIFPNPVTSSISIALQHQNQNQTSITIKNILGQPVFTESSQTPNSQLSTKMDLSFLQNGMYFLEININEEKRVRKIVKQ